MLIVRSVFLALLSTLPLQGSRAEDRLAPAQQRLAAATELQRTFDSSLVKGLELKFLVRGDHCEVLNVEGWNLYDTMMSCVAHGTVIYGTILPGGVNRFAFNRGFRDVVYTNRDDEVFAAFGPSKLTRAQAVKLRKCTVEMARSVTTEPAVPATQPTPPTFELLTRATAVPGQKLYKDPDHHDATIVSVDDATDIMMVKFVRSGTTEPKSLSAIPKLWWYVRK